MTTRNSGGRQLTLPAVNFDLHCHLRGTMQPSHAAILAEKHGVSLSVPLEVERYSFSTFEDFLSLYEQIGRVIRSAEDLRDVAFRYLRSASKANSIYVEFMISPGHSISNGIPFYSQISAISEAIEEAESKFGILSSIIITCVRHRGPNESLDVAEMAATARSRHVRGFGLTGNERVFDVEAFKGAFLIAEDSGLGLTAHAGEWLPAETVLHTVKTLNLSRVGHGISVADKPEVMLELAELGIGFEICMSSNVILGASESYESHPARRLINSGCKVTFCTDDPAYFRTTPDGEMKLAKKHLVLTEDEQWRIIGDSINMAFCDEAMKSKLRLISNVTN